MDDSYILWTLPFMDHQPSFYFMIFMNTDRKVWFTLFQKAAVTSFLHLNESSASKISQFLSLSLFANRYKWDNNLLANNTLND